MDIKFFWEIRGSARARMIRSIRLHPLWFTKSFKIPLISQSWNEEVVTVSIALLVLRHRLLLNKSLRCAGHSLFLFLFSFFLESRDQRATSKLTTKTRGRVESRSIYYRIGDFENWLVVWVCIAIGKWKMEILKGGHAATRSRVWWLLWLSGVSRKTTLSLSFKLTCSFARSARQS